MSRTAWLLAWRSLIDRPLRSALLLLGYGVGVAVMIALLSVGDALLAQARDRDLAAGGDLVLLPEGVDPAVLKVNGVTGLFLTIQHAGFIVRSVLGGPRFEPEIAAVAPEIRDRIVYLRVRDKIVPANASAGVPSLDHAAHATQAVPTATDSAADRAWLDPSPAVLFDRLDHFHRPRDGDRAAWAEWDYFNFIDSADGAYGYITFLAGGEGTGAILLRLVVPSCHSLPVYRGVPSRRDLAACGAWRLSRGNLGVSPDDVVIPVHLRPGDVSTATVAQRIGPALIRVESGRYHLTVDDPRVHADLWLTPALGVYLPAGETAAGGVTSGYVVPVVRGRMDGEIRTPRTTLRLAQAPAYHDHNWGTWCGVTWEWGEASGPGGAVLYGALHVPGDEAAGVGGRPPALFLWGPAGGGRGGFLGAFAIRSLSYRGWHPGPSVAGRRAAAPAEITIIAGEGDTIVNVRIRVEDVLGSVPAATQPTSSLRSASGAAREGNHGSSRLPARVFLQMRGTAEVHGSVDGRPLEWRGPAAAETFVPRGIK